MDRRGGPHGNGTASSGDGRQMARQFARDESASALARSQVTFVEQLPVRHYRDVARDAQFEREVARGRHARRRGQSPAENLTSERPVNLIVQGAVRIELQEHPRTSGKRPYYARDWRRKWILNYFLKWNYAMVHSHSAGERMIDLMDAIEQLNRDMLPFAKLLGIRFVTRDAGMRDGGDEGSRGHVHAARDSARRRDDGAGRHARRLCDLVESARRRDDHHDRIEDQLHRRPRWLAPPCARSASRFIEDGARWSGRRG